MIRKHTANVNSWDQIVVDCDYLDDTTAKIRRLSKLMRFMTGNIRRSAENIRNGIAASQTGYSGMQAGK